MSYAKYESYKDSGVDWLGEIPSDWELLKVKNIFRLVMKFAPKNNDCELLSVYTDIGVKPRKELEERGNRATTTDGYLIVEKGDIVVNKLLAWMGAIGLSDYDGVTSPAYDILKPKIPIEGIFYHLLFRSPQCTSELRRYSRGIMDMRLRLYFDKFGDVVVPYPNIEVQKKIVSFLAKKTTQIDQAIALKQQQIEKLGEYKQIVIQNAVTKGLNPNAPMKKSGVEWIGDIPEHWEIKKLKFIAEINKNSLPENTRKDFTFQYVDIGSVSFENGITATEEYIFQNAPSRARRIAKANDTIISTVRTYLKAIDYIDANKADYIYSTGFAVLTPKNEILPKFLTSFVWSLAFTNQVKDFSKGMSYPAINSTDLGNLFLTVPPNNEQVKIVEHIKNLNCKISDTIQSYQTQIDRLKEYKNILINQAVTGKIKI